jgi:hypothetical protein
VLTFPRSAKFIQFAKLDLHLAIHSLSSLGLSTENQVNLVNVKESRIRVPPIFEELKLRIGLSQYFIVAGPAADMGG